MICGIFSIVFKFQVIKKDVKTRARVGEITTAHGIIKTPAFVPVGTKATVKGLTPQDLKEAGVQLLFGNTYHLHLRPGEDLVKKFGGISKFMSWNGPTISDSGGFQVFSLGKIVRLSHVSDDARLFDSKTDQLNSASLSKSRLQSEPKPTFSSSESEQAHFEKIRLVKITEDGVEFRSHIDGSKHLFTPEISIQIQKKLGADLILAFDECAPHPSSHEYTKEAMERTHKWALRSLAAFKSKIQSTKSQTISNIQNSNNKKVSNSDIRYSNFYYPYNQALYGITQGGVYKDLRIESAKFISKLNFDGIAIGGVAVGESKKQMIDAVDWSMPYLPKEKPKHLLGVGEVDDIFEIIERGIDTFDCVIPTRFGRYGIIFIGPPLGNIKNRFRIDINRTSFANDKSPIAKNCACYVCSNFTRAYIHHLFRAQELLAYRLASYHNMFFINNLVREIRCAILDGNFVKMKREWVG